MGSTLLQNSQPAIERMKLPRIHIGRPQRLAALLLLFFLAECLWVVSHQQLSQQDYRFARCGREMWERPSPLAGYFTTCGNLNGDGTFAYRVAGFPLTVAAPRPARRRPLPQARKPPLRRRLPQRLHLGSAPPARQRQLSPPPALRRSLPSGSAAGSGGSRAASSATKAASSRSASTVSAPPSSATPSRPTTTSSPCGDSTASSTPPLESPTPCRARAANGVPASPCSPSLSDSPPPRTCWPRSSASSLALVFMLYLAERRRSYVMQILIFSAHRRTGHPLRLLRLPAASPSATSSPAAAARFWFSLEGVAQLLRQHSRNAPIVIATAVALSSTSPSAAAATSATPPRCVMLLAARPAHHHPDRQRAVAVGAAVPLHLPRRRLRRRPRNPPPQALPRPHRRILLAQAILCLTTLPQIAR